MNDALRKAPEPMSEEDRERIIKALNDRFAEIKRTMDPEDARAQIREIEALRDREGYLTDTANDDEEWLSDETSSAIDRTDAGPSRTFHSVAEMHLSERIEANPDQIEPAMRELLATLEKLGSSEELLKLHQEIRYGVDQPSFDKVTRIEVIGSERTVVTMNAQNVRVLLQDDDRTLKVFYEDTEK